jgi:hypothetical protein
LAGAGFVVLVLAGARTSAAAPPAGREPTLEDEGLTPEVMPDGGIPPGSVVWHPWSIFDPYLAPRSFILTGGPVWERLAGQGYEHPGFEVTGGRSIETPRSPWEVQLEAEYGFRVSGQSHWVVSLARYSYGGGLLLGPLELSARAGLTAAEVHFGSSGFGLGFFSPRVSGGVAFEAGRVRVGVLAFSEYAWRWLGGPSAFVQGVLLEVSVGHSPDGLPPRYRIKN